MRNGVRIGDLANMEYFEQRLRGLVIQLKRAYPDLVIDVEKELAYYRSIREEILPMITDSVVYIDDALKDGKRILIEGANATSKKPLTGCAGFVSLVLLYFRLLCFVLLYCYYFFFFFFCYFSYFFLLLCGMLYIFFVLWQIVSSPL
jgi:hypothetical protein